MDKVGVVKIRKEAFLPEFQTTGSAGADVRCIDAFSLGPKETKLIKLGFILDIPSGFEIQVRPRSGLALRNGLIVPNSPGTIDEDFVHENCVILHNNSSTAFMAEAGTRIAQFCLRVVPKCEYVEVDSLSEKNSDRAGGFGSTGIL